MKKNHILALLVLILLLASATRFDQIDERSLWEDEGWTLLLSNGDSLSDVVQTMANDQHPPLYFVFIKYWRDLTGESELALRTLSVLMSILSVAGMYQFGRVTFGVRAGILVAALFAVWDFSIDVAQDARQYSQLTLFVILSCMFYFRYLQNPSRSNALGWFLASVAALYTQYMAGVVLAIQLLHLLIFARPRRHLINMLFYFGAICLAFLPWLFVFIRQNQVRWTDPIYYQSGLPNIEATFLLMRDAMVSKQFGLVIGLMLLGLVFIRYVPRLKIGIFPVRATLFLALWIVGYIGLIVWLNEDQEILRLRIFILCVPPILLLVAHGLTNLQRVPQIFLLAVLLITSIYTIDTRQNNPPWREVVQNVTDFHQPGEPVLMDIWVGDFSARYYVEQQIGKNTPWLSIRELRRETQDQFLPQLVTYLQNIDAFWLLRWNDDPADYDPLLAELGFQRTASPYVLHEGNYLYSHRYDRLTDERLASFGETIHLQKAAVNGEMQPGETITVTLWWSVEQAPPVDYSISVRLLDENGALIRNWDGPPLEGQSPTSAWQPGTIYYDQHQLTFPADLPAGNYWIGISIYWYQEPDQPLAVQSDQAGVAQEGVARIAEITVGANE